jgi:tetratricopeptide (TPR) repeat protein
MFRRRRPFRRPPPLRRRPPVPPPPLVRPPRRPLAAKARKALARANRLMSDEQFVEAGNIFERLAGEAEKHGLFVRAAELALQASRARFAAEDVEAALAQAKRALRLFVRGGRPGRIPQLLSRMAAALREKGYAAQAAQLEQEAAQILAETGLSLDEARQQVPRAPEKRGSLPASCNGCGAPLVPDEVEWHDAHTAECPYCGTIAKAT